MDPNVAYIALFDESRTIEDRIESALALRGWIRSGGFLPINTDRRTVVLDIESTLMLAAVPS